MLIPSIQTAVCVFFEHNERESGNYNQPTLLNYFSASYFSGVAEGHSLNSAIGVDRTQPQ